MFAKHLQNTKIDRSKIKDSTKLRLESENKRRNEYYAIRDEMILKETKFSIHEEQQYQKKCHYRFESNNADVVKPGKLPIIEELNKNK